MQQLHEITNEENRDHWHDVGPLDQSLVIAFEQPE